MTKLTLGNLVPDFTLKDQNNEDVTLSSFKGKKVLLSWHPLAWTGVCTDQMRALERNHQRLADLNTVPLGLSVDPQPSKAAWAAALGLNNVKILADFWPHGKVSSDYDIFYDEYGMSKRANFIVDEEGKLLWFKIYRMSELPDIEEVIEQLAK